MVPGESCISGVGRRAFRNVPRCELLLCVVTGVQCSVSCTVTPLHYTPQCTTLAGVMIGDNVDRRPCALSEDAGIKYFCLFHALLHISIMQIRCGLRRQDQNIFVLGKVHNNNINGIFCRETLKLLISLVMTVTMITTQLSTFFLTVHSQLNSLHGLRASFLIILPGSAFLFATRILVDLK